MSHRSPSISVATGLPLGARAQLGRELARRVRRAASRLDLSAEEIEGVSIYVVDDRTIARLNLQHMGKRGPTDVLSFPAAQTSFALLTEDGEGDDGGVRVAAPAPSLGDIVLSWPAITRQARGVDHAAHLDEATVLAIHGLCHLLGHDHRQRREGRAMHRLELRGLGAARVTDISRPYGLRPVRPER